MIEKNTTVVKHIYKKPLRVGEAAKLCHLSKKTIQNLINEKKLAAYPTHGGHWRIWPGDLAQLIRKRGTEASFSFIETRLRHVLIIDNRPAALDRLTKTVRLLRPAASVTTTADSHHTMFYLGKESPKLIIANASVPNLPLADMLHMLALQKNDFSPTMVLGIQSNNLHHVTETTKKSMGINIMTTPIENVDTAIIALLRRS